MSGSENIQGKIQQEIAELTQSVASLVESVRKLRNPIAETQRKVPQATNQLDKISEQTEKAAHQMLDHIERITQREEETIKGLGELKEMADVQNQIECAKLTGQLLENANTNLNDAYALMDALQFQDITSQQMDHAAALLEEIETRLHAVLGAIGGEGASELGEARPKKSRAYDPHADLFERKTEQKEIDSLFAQGKSK